MSSSVERGFSASVSIPSASSRHRSMSAGRTSGRNLTAGAARLASWNANSVLALSCSSLVSRLANVSLIPAASIASASLASFASIVRSYRRTCACRCYFLPVLYERGLVRLCGRALYVKSDHCLTPRPERMPESGSCSLRVASRLSKAYHLLSLEKVPMRRPGEHKSPDATHDIAGRSKFCRCVFRGLCRGGRRFADSPREASKQ